MDSDSSGQVSGQGVSRRQAIKTALTVGTYAAPLILSAAVPAPVAAQASGPTGALTGTVSSAANAAPIAGATVTVGSASALTNGSGVYTIPNAPSGLRSVSTSAPGFSTRTDSVNIAAGGSTLFSTALVPSSASGAVTIVLTWGASPSDLDSHLVGPVLPSGRFHCYYGSSAPVAYASLDIDDTSGFGPETTSITTASGNFVPGSYSFYVHNYSGGTFAGSGAVVTVFQGGLQIGQFLVSAASGTASSQYWTVFSFTLTATPTGAIAITTDQLFTNIAPARDASPLPPKG